MKEVTLHHQAILTSPNLKRIGTMWGTVGHLVTFRDGPHDSTNRVTVTLSSLYRLNNYSITNTNEQQQLISTLNEYRTCLKAAVPFQTPPQKWDWTVPILSKWPCKSRNSSLRGKSSDPTSYFIQLQSIIMFIKINLRWKMNREL